MNIKLSATLQLERKRAHIDTHFTIPECVKIAIYLILGMWIGALRKDESPNRGQDDARRDDHLMII